MLKSRVHLFKYLPFVFFAVGIVYTNTIYAHAQLMLDSATPPRYNSPSVKTFPPCGRDADFGDKRTERKSIFQTGETITLEWVETVEHGGSYVFDFSASPEQGFDTNALATVPDEQNNRASIPHYYSHDITLDSQACDACILRMRQDMEDREDYYYSCADIVIVSGADEIPPMEVPVTGVSALADSVELTWMTQPDYKAILVLKNTQANVDAPADRNDYLEGDRIGSSTVVYKGTASSFTDSALTAETEYTYKVFAYDANYNYNAGVTKVVATDSALDTGAGGATGGGAGTGDSDSGGGALYGLLLLLLMRRCMQGNVGKGM